MTKYLGLDFTKRKKFVRNTSQRNGACNASSPHTSEGLTWSTYIVTVTLVKRKRFSHELKITFAISRVSAPYSEKGGGEGERGGGRGEKEISYPLCSILDGDAEQVGE